jgi:hypothetical protein
MTEVTPFLPGLSPVGAKSLTAARDAGNLTSNGGLIVLRESALRLGVADVVAAPLPDTRNQLLVIHSYGAMVTARMMAIAAGHEDADDLDALRNDPALMIACKQPTISRLENLADVKALYRIDAQAQEVARLFNPYFFDQHQRVAGSNGRFVHYTSAGCRSSAWPESGGLRTGT